MDQYTDQNGRYTLGTDTFGAVVHIYGERNGFTYLAYARDLSWLTKVPSSWITA